MWKSSRRVVLIAAGVLVIGAGAVGLAWFAKLLPIEFGQPDAGQISAENVEGLDLKPEGQLVESTEQNRDQLFQTQSEPEPQFDGTVSRVPVNRLADRNEQTTELLFPPQQSTADSDLPREFPAFEPPRSPASNSSRGSRGTIQQAGFEESSNPTEREPVAFDSPTETRTFEPEKPRTLRQAQQFPRQVALLDRYQNQDSNEQPAASTTPQPEPFPEQSDNEFVAPQSQPAATRIAARSEPLPEGKADLRKIDQLHESGDVVGAHRELSKIYWNEPELRSVILPRIEKTAQAIYFAPQPHFVEPYVIQSGDKLERIGPKYQVPWQYLAMVNKVDPRRIRVGQKLKVIKGPFSVFVDLSDFELTVHAHGFFVKRFAVGIGKDGASPIGKFTVLEKVEKPQYTDPQGKVTAGGAPTNPLGTHWIDIGNSYGIHGTIEPDSIGKAESRGCIRMRNEDVTEVYNFLVKGSEVVIRQ